MSSYQAAAAMAYAYQHQQQQQYHQINQIQPPPPPLQINHLLNHTHQQQLTSSQTINDFNLSEANAATSSFIETTKKQHQQQQANVNRLDQIKLRDRQTPMLHNRPHPKAIFAGFNCLLEIKPNDPCEGQPALVEIHNLNDLLDDYLSTDKDYQQIQEFPGPLEINQTPKATVIQYCQRKIKEYQLGGGGNFNYSLQSADPQSNLLLWEYLALLVRQNGRVDLRTDIPALLLNDEQTNNWHLPQNTNGRSNGVNGNGHGHGHTNTGNDELNELNDELSSLNIKKTNLSEDEIMSKLRQFLSSGQLLDAIEFSIKHNQWSHAFYLSFQYTSATGDRKLLEKTKLRFLNNSLQPNDPLQTCYQLLNGRVPTITSNMLQTNWNDWRRHLAMIVSNLNDQNKELCLQSIRTLADCLATNSRIAAAHFCYLLANVNFGEYKKKSSKIVLIGSSHKYVDPTDFHQLNFSFFSKHYLFLISNSQPFSKFCDLASIQATEIYEFARQSTIDSFLVSPAAHLSPSIFQLYLFYLLFSIAI